MEIFLNTIGIVIGFCFLIKGADIFVDGASKIARKLGIPSIIIGLTIVAMGTSLPEMMVSVVSSISGKNDMSIANVSGSNLFNICMVLGLSAIFSKSIYTNRKKISNYVSTLIKTITFTNKDITSKFLIASSLVLCIFCLIDNKLSRVEGFVLLVMLAMYIVNLIKSSKDSSLESTDSKVEDIPIFSQILLIIIGSVGIIIGGEIVVKCATNVGELIGLSENVIGLTIIAMGTSLPELVTSLVAIKKGESDIALGNALGSNILNILLVLGVSSMISPIVVTTVALIDMMIVLVISLSISTILQTRNNILSKNAGIIYVLMYIGYTVYAFIR